MYWWYNCVGIYFHYEVLLYSVYGVWCFLSNLNFSLFLLHSCCASSHLCCICCPSKGNLAEHVSSVGQYSLEAMLCVCVYNHVVCHICYKTFILSLIALQFQNRSSFTTTRVLHSWRSHYMLSLKKPSMWELYFLWLFFWWCDFLWIFFLS